ncbi:MAG: T9SS type A sorting domain-containing protein [Flavobacterium sp.]
MKKTILLFLLFVASWQINAQSTCTQTFTASGQDGDPTVLTINASSVNCYGANPVTSLKLVNAAGSLASGFCSTDASSWFGFDLSIDGAPAITGCDADFNNIDITGFTTLTITSHDDDAYSDGIEITIDVEATYTASLPPFCTALSSPINGAVDVSSTVVAWPVAAGGPTGYKLNVGTTPGGTNVLNAFDVGNVLTHDLGILNSSTTYYVTVIPYNAIGNATGTCTESSFTTCGAVSVLPWIENFDSLGSVGTTSFPGCWTKENGGWATAVAGTYTLPRSGANYLRNSWSATDEFMWTKGFNLVAGTSYDFSAYVQGDNGDSWVVDMFANNAASSVGATPLGASYAVPGDNTSYSPQAYAEMRRTFVPSTSGVYYFAVRVNEPSGDPWYIAFDDLRVEVTPACSAPSNLLTSNLTSVSADIAWNAVPGSVNYEYVLNGTAADPAGSGTSTMALMYSAASLTPSTTYYFHVRNNCGAQFSAWSTQSFTTLLTPPANDNCGNAIVLTPGGDFSAYPLTATNVGATASAGETVPGCASYLGGDVWYSVVVPASGSLTFENNGVVGGITDSAGAVYSGTCGALTLLDCDDSSSSDPNDHPLIQITGRTAGEVLYYRVWEYGNNSFGQFAVSAYDPSLSAASFDMNGFSAYPNPVKDILNLSYTKEISSVSVYNLLGQVVMTKTINATQSKVDLSTLASGTYLVKVNVDGLLKTIKIVKQ